MEPEKPLEQVIQEDGRYPAEAYAFLREGLAKSVKEVYGQEESSGQHHVTGRQLCLSLKSLAAERWGLLARTVLGRWNIRATIDFGNMVYLMIQHGYMKKTDEDSLEDFRNVYTFAEAFRDRDEFELKE